MDEHAMNKAMLNIKREPNSEREKVPIQNEIQQTFTSTPRGIRHQNVQPETHQISGTPDLEEMVISMPKSTYHTHEGSSAAFIDCIVDPLPESIVWKKGQGTKPEKRIPVDNRKYFYSPKAPTLIIRDPNILADEANYQCTVAANGKTVIGDMVHLEVSAATTTNAQRSNIPTSSHSSVEEPKLAQQEQGPGVGTKMNESKTLITDEQLGPNKGQGTKRSRSAIENTSQPDGKKANFPDADKVGVTTKTGTKKFKWESDVRHFIEIVKKQNIEEFKQLKSQIISKKKKASRSIPHIVAMYGSAEMIECLKNWNGVNLDEECENLECILEDELKGITVKKATALYLAAFRNKVDIVQSLIKCASEDNIRICLRTLRLNKSIEKVFMLDLAEKIKTEYMYSHLDPAVIPGHRIENDGSRTRVFIVYSVHVTQTEDINRDDIGLVMLRNPYKNTKGTECKPEKTISSEDAKRAEKALSRSRDSLWKKHSNLNIIGVSPLKYRGNGTEIIEKPCIELYCSTKGVVPLGEPEFPKRLCVEENDFIDVDIHEGNFRFGRYDSVPSIYPHPTLKMGCSIGRSTAESDAFGNQLQSIGGTLGPFVNFNDSFGFLTCAHVLFDAANTSKQLKYEYKGKNKTEIVQPSTNVTTVKGSSCGHIHKVIFSPQLDPSVDVAVVELTDANRIPTSGQFANTTKSSYKDAGFEELPEYNRGLIERVITHSSRPHTVVKFGSSTDVTRGVLDVCRIDVRPLSTVLGSPRHTGSAKMTNQYRVFGVHPTNTFFDGGDSGSAVFMKSPGTGELVCIGMGMGYLNVNTSPFPLAVVTPIGAILDALGPRYTIASFE